jgi:microcystin degradation protein MlrC
LPKRRLAIARLWYEANSFSPLRTDLTAFKNREWGSGEAARAFYADTATEIGGVLALEPEYPDWEFHYLHCTAAPPGGLVQPDAFAEIARLILDGIGARTWDAVYLSLHGAMATIDDPTPEFHLPCRWPPVSTCTGISVRRWQACSMRLRAITPIRTSTWMRRRSAR